MENKDNEMFQYTYSAGEQEELRAIRQRYTAPAEEDSMTRLRRLDAGVTKKATAASLVVGVIGALLLGSGMSLTMTEIGAHLGLLPPAAMLIGVGIGAVGIALVCCAYPVYNRTAERERKKIAPEIIRLTDELMK